MVTDQLLFGGAGSRCEQTASSDTHTSGSATALLLESKEESGEGAVCWA